MLDSLNFLPMALSKLPGAFSLEEIRKGYFPHLYNKKENWGTVKSWPDAHYYQPEYMSVKDREKFLNWHAQQVEKQFNFDEEIRLYCISDVNILRRTCLKFRYTKIVLPQCLVVSTNRENILSET